MSPSTAKCRSPEHDQGCPHLRSSGTWAPQLRKRKGSTKLLLAYFPERRRHVKRLERFPSNEVKCERCGGCQEFTSAERHGKLKGKAVKKNGGIGKGEEICLLGFRSVLPASLQREDLNFILQVQKKKKFCKKFGIQRREVS